MATKHEDHKTEHKDRPMPVQGDRTAVPEQGVRIDDIRKADINRPKSFLDEPMDPRTGLRGRPESPSDNPGQKTRDNVTPVIPSAPPREGGIVDPTSLGMPQGGVQPVYPPPVKSVNEPSAPAEQVVDPENLPPGHFNASVNEPPGSDVGGAGNAIEEGGEGGGTPDVVTLTGVTPATGVIGADVPITAAGTGFTEASVITFGGTALATTYGSATSLTATAPGVAAAEGPVDVTVDGSSPVQFTWALVAGDDPDDMEAELEDAEDDGDYTTTSKKTKPKGRR